MVMSQIRELFQLLPLHESGKFKFFSDISGHARFVQIL